ncbi:MAG: arginase family protein [Promethearchaeota archaeon]
MGQQFFKIFGAALDPNDDPLKILAKCSYLNRLARNLIDLDKDFMDPYEGIIKYSQVLKNKRFKKIGKFPIETWLTPKPKIKDFTLLDPLRFQKFTNSGEIYNYSKKLEEFVNIKVLPDIPLMIGVDHSLTGGVLRALSKKFGPENILVIIFDAHFDGIPANLSLNLAKFAYENKEKVNLLFPQQLGLIDLDSIELKNSYTCSSYLEYLIKDDIILPKKLIIFGCQDYPSEEMKSEEDIRVKEYVDYYLSYEKRGVKFIPATENREDMIKQLDAILTDFDVPYIYISIDVDISMFREVLAARFTNIIGIEIEVVKRAALAIKTFIDLKKCNLIGLDIMEIETYMLNKKLKKSGESDKTIELIDDFLNIFLK